MSENPNLNAVGEVSPRVMQIIKQGQAQSQQIIQQIGQIEVRKMQLLRAMDQIDSDTRRIIDAEGMRLGIPEGSPWQITPEGKAILMPKE